VFYKGREDMKKNFIFKKLNEDDILEIIVEHFQETECYDFIRAKAYLYGEPGKDLRLIAVFSNDEQGEIPFDFDKLDKEMDYNGDHSFLKKHPEFHSTQSSQNT
jgi:hypothetical protein